MVWIRCFDKTPEPEPTIREGDVYSRLKSALFLWLNSAWLNWKRVARLLSLHPHANAQKRFMDTIKCATLEQTTLQITNWIDRRPSNIRPILFYRFRCCCNITIWHQRIETFSLCSCQNLYLNVFCPFNFSLFFSPFRRLQRNDVLWRACNAATSRTTARKSRARIRSEWLVAAARCAPANCSVSFIQYKSPQPCTTQIHTAHTSRIPFVYDVYICPRHILRDIAHKHHK